MTLEAAFSQFRGSHGRFLGVLRGGVMVRKALAVLSRCPDGRLAGKLQVFRVRYQKAPISIEKRLANGTGTVDNQDHL